MSETASETKARRERGGGRGNASGSELAPQATNHPPFRSGSNMKAGRSLRETGEHRQVGVKLDAGRGRGEAPPLHPLEANEDSYRCVGENLEPQWVL